MVIKVFDDLDLLLFHRDLKHRVNVRWESFKLINSARLTRNDPERVVFAFTTPPVPWAVPRVRIRLNADVD